MSKGHPPIKRRGEPFHERRVPVYHPGPRPLRDGHYDRDLEDAHAEYLRERASWGRGTRRQGPARSPIFCRRLPHGDEE